LVLGTAELDLTRKAKNLSDAAALPPLDTVVQIFKDPIQPLREGAANAAFARSHKTHQKDGIHPRASRLFRGRSPHTNARFRARRFARTFLRTIRFVFLAIFQSVF
jgi:hypothetical protein